MGRAVPTAATLSAGAPDDPQTRSHVRRSRGLWLRTHHLPYRQRTRYQLKIGRSVSCFYPHRGTIFVDGEDEARERTGLAALEAVLRDQGYLGGPTAPTTPSRRAGPTEPTLSVIDRTAPPATPGSIQAER